MPIKAGTEVVTYMLIKAGTEVVQNWLLSLVSCNRSTY